MGWEASKVWIQLGKLGKSLRTNDLNPDFEVNVNRFYSTDLPWQLALLWAGSSGQAKQQEVAGIQIESQSSRWSIEEFVLRQ